MQKTLHPNPAGTPQEGNLRQAQGRPYNSQLNLIHNPNFAKNKKEVYNKTIYKNTLKVLDKSSGGGI